MPASERAPPLVNERVIPAFAGMTSKKRSYCIPSYFLLFIKTFPFHVASLSVVLRFGGLRCGDASSS